MKLSLKMIAEGLEDQTEILKFKDMFSKMRLTRPLFLTDESELLPDTLYLASAQQLPEHLHWSDGAALILSGPKEMDILQFPAVILLDEDADLLRIHNRINRIFDQFDAWERDLDGLRTLAEGPEALRQCLRVSVSVLHNPLTFSDAEGHCLLCEGADAHDAGALLNFLQEKPVIRQLLTEQEPFLLPTPDRENRLMVRNIFSGNDLKYRLAAIESFRPFRETDYLLLDILAEALERMIRPMYLGSEDHAEMLAALLRDMLSGETADLSLLSMELRKMHWEMQGLYQVLSVTLQETDALLDLFSEYPRKLRQDLKDAVVFRMHSRYIFLLNLKQMFPEEAVAPTLELQDLAADRILPFLQEHALTGGVSNIFASIRDFPAYYRQADAACDYALKHASANRLFSFRDCAFEYVIQTESLKASKMDLLSPVYLRLKEHDLQNNTEYLKTLDEYLRQNMNAVQTASALFIHRATIIYRIKRICEIGHTNLKEPDELLHLALSFKLDS